MVPILLGVKPVRDGINVSVRVCACVCLTVRVCLRVRLCPYFGGSERWSFIFIFCLAGRNVPIRQTQVYLDCALVGRCLLDFGLCGENNILSLGLEIETALWWVLGHLVHYYSQNDTLQENKRKTTESNESVILLVVLARRNVHRIRYIFAYYDCKTSLDRMIVINPIRWNSKFLVMRTRCHSMSLAMTTK